MLYCPDELQVSNAFDSSLVMLNPAINEVEELKQMLVLNNLKYLFSSLTFDSNELIFYIFYCFLLIGFMLMINP